MQVRKKNVLLLFGGRSVEHEISCRSAASIVSHLDRSLFQIVPVGISKTGVWYYQDSCEIKDGVLQIQSSPHRVHFYPYPRETKRADATFAGLIELQGALSGEFIGIDVVFPIVHGTYGEDGTLQGLLELAELPFVGAGVLTSALGMDKQIAKTLVQAAGVAVTPHFVVLKRQWDQSGIDPIVKRIKSEFNFPVFVKPARLGSSVGIHKVQDEARLEVAVLDAFKYDTKIMIEKAIDVREIEIAVLEPLNGLEPLLSSIGEIIPKKSVHDFYSYDAKYLDENGAMVQIPASLKQAENLEVQNIAKIVYQALQIDGMSRIDLFLDQKTGVFYFNEINTAPGFTSISLFPKAFEHAGLSYPHLLTHLMEVSLKNQSDKKKLIRNFNP